MSLEGRDYFYDPIWGFFEPPPEVMKVLDTHELQRLSRITQLSTVNLVYRSANHTRLEHSLGVTSLMDKVLNRFQIDPSAWPSQKEFQKHTKPAKWRKLKRFAEICALIHDVGHGPFSHFVEPFLHWTSEGQERVLTNEDIGKEVILGRYKEVDKDLAPENADFLSDVLEDISKKLGFSIDDFAWYVANEKQFNDAVRLGEFVIDEPCLFIRKLISSPMDMDRVDFLNRDAYFVGLKAGVDPNSIIQNISLVSEDNKTLDLVLEEAGICHVENLLASRDLMYAIVYHHPINRWGLAAILRAAYRLYKERHVPPQYILRQTDSALLAMLKEGDRYTRQIAERIEERHHYCRVYQLEFSYLNLLNSENNEEVIKRIEELEKNPLELVQVEERVESKLSSSCTQNGEEIDVIIDIPPEPKFVEAEVKVRICGHDCLVSLNRVSGMARYISERRKERRWFLNVFTNATKTAHENIANLVKRELQIPKDEKPERLLREERVM